MYRISEKFTGLELVNIDGASGWEGGTFWQIGNNDQLYLIEDPFLKNIKKLSNCTL